MFYTYSEFKKKDINSKMLMLMFIKIREIYFYSFRELFSLSICLSIIYIFIIFILNTNDLSDFIVNLTCKNVEGEIDRGFCAVKFMLDTRQMGAAIARMCTLWSMDTEWLIKPF